MNRDWKEFIESLNRADVRYLIVGGIAVAAHGHVRYTKDLDVWVEASKENALRIVAAIDDFGLGSLNLVPEDFEKERLIVQLGYEPKRIDILTKISGVTFSDAYPHAVVTELMSVPTRVIDKQRLCTNKLASGRLQDLADVEALGAQVPEEALVDAGRAAKAALANSVKKQPIKKKPKSC